MDFEILFDLVRGNVDSGTLIFGSGIATDAWVHPK